MNNRNAHIREGTYAKLVARLYDPFMESLEQKVLSRYRSELLANLEGDVLEVGSGTGINFRLYPKKCRVLASEPSEHMLKYAQFRYDNEVVEADIRLIQAGVGDPKLEELIPTEGLDAVVCTLVLCTIPEPELAVQSFVKWLKPNGQLIILEHVHGDSQPRKFLHNAINPLWKRLAEGCHVNRDTKKLLIDTGFKPVWEKRFTKMIPFYVAKVVKV